MRNAISSRRLVALAVMLCCLVAQVCAAEQQPGKAAADGSADVTPPIVSKYVGVYTRPPDTVGSLDPAIKAYRIPDGPLMGNGDLAVAVGGTAATQTFYLSKSDLSQSARGLGGLTFSFDRPAADDGSAYRQEQDLYRAEVRSVIPLRRATVRMRSWTADDGNLLVTELSADNTEPLDVDLKLWPHAGGANTRAGTDDGLLWATRDISTTLGPERQPFNSAAAMAVRVMGATPVCSGDGNDSCSARFSLPAGKAVRVVTAVAGGHDAPDPVGGAKRLAASQTDQTLDDHAAAHLSWWKAYWSKSSIETGEGPLEKFYYGALYVLGCSSRAGSVAPGLAGPWHLNGPICWANKYTLDYNFEAAWWGVYSSNHADLAEPYYDVILKLIPAGRKLAQEHGTRGVLFGVNAHAWGGFTDTRTLNMKGNASLAALNFMAHYGYTRDERFLVDKAWPLLRELADFWEDNLVRDDATGRWGIHDSGAREGQHDTNAVNDLAYVDVIFRFLLETSDTLEGKRSGGQPIHIPDVRKAKWRDYVANLSPYPTTVLDGRTVFKEAENRTKMSLGGAGDNSDVLDHVFPAEAIGLGSDPKLLEIARNTVAALNPDDGKASWFQANSFPKIYTQAVRSGCPAEEVIEPLERLLAGRQPYDDRGDHARLRDNLTINPPAHSFESVGAVEAIDSMFLQSRDGTIRVFPVWLKGKDASFTNLRARGAFLVSGEYRSGAVAHIDITSETGGDCAVANPWGDTPCEVVRISPSGPEKVDFRSAGGAIVFGTEKGSRYRVRERAAGGPAIAPPHGPAPRPAAAPRGEPQSDKAVPRR
jgi:alpha-L-fucosidase 2